MRDTLSVGHARHKWLMGQFGDRLNDFPEDISGSTEIEVFSHMTASYSYIDLVLRSSTLTLTLPLLLHLMFSHVCGEMMGKIKK